MRISTLIFLLSAPILLRGQTTSNAFQKVYDIMQAKCATCHSNATKSGGLDLEGSGTVKSDAVFLNLVNADPTNAVAKSKGHKRVYPGRADRSFLFHKINGSFDTYYSTIGANEGSLMPKQGTVLTNIEKEIIRQWILFGANKTYTVPEGRIRAYYDTVGRAMTAFETPPAAPSASEGFQIKMGPFFLAPQGQKESELEYYQKWELSLANDVEVNRIDHQIAPFSHHLIIYNYNTTAAASTIAAGMRLDPYHQNISLVSAVQEKTDLRLPDKTAFKWTKDIILDLNSHCINYSANHVYKNEAFVNVYTQPNGMAKQQMYAILIANNNIPIPNNNKTTTIESNFGLFGKIYVWGLMGHTHKYGTGYKVFKLLPNNVKGELLYDASCPNGLPGCQSPFYDYKHIPIRYFLPLKAVELNPGIVHQATWVNTGDAPVNWGPTSNDEMMIAIAFYTRDTAGLASPTIDLKTLEGVRLFPNPAKGNLTLEVPPSVSGLKFTLFDLLGRVVRTETQLTGSSVTIQRGDIPSGMYIYKVEDARGLGHTGKVLLE